MNEKEINTDVNEETLSYTAVENSAVHRHHRHHSRQYYWYRRNKHKIKKFFRKHKVWSVLLSLLLVAAIVSVGLAILNNAQKTDTNAQEMSPTTVTEKDNETLDIHLSYFDEPQLLVNPIVSEFVNGDGKTSLFQIMQNVTDQSAVSQPETVVLSLGLNSLPTDIKINKAVIEVADNAEFAGAEAYDVTLTRGSAELKFLYTGTVYYYRADVELSNQTTLHAEGQFETASSPRLIALDGTLNVRDIGGWPTTDGNRIRQGMLYRGAEIDGAYDKALQISAQGISDAHKYLGIVSDFDLRALTTEIPAESAFGATTKHLTFGAYDYETVLTPVSQSYLKELFSALADESNYPVYLHCSYGLDRSGTACYLLEALLGMSEENLNKEFELTCLTFYANNPYEQGGHYPKFLEAFQALPGNSAQEKAEKYLLSCGVTRKEIEQIKAILLED